MEVRAAGGRTARQAEIALTTQSCKTRLGRIRETLQVAVSVCPAFNSATMSSASAENRGGGGG